MKKIIFILFFIFPTISYSEVKTITWDQIKKGYIFEIKSLHGKNINKSHNGNSLSFNEYFFGKIKMQNF